MKNLKLKYAFAALGFILLQSCSEFESEVGFEEIVQFSSSTININEDATDPITITVQLVGPQISSPINVDYTITTDLVEGDDYTFPNGKELVIDANSSTASIQIAAIDDEEIADGAQTITLTITNADGISIGGETAPRRSIVVGINENDFFCARNDLAKVVTTETDLGYSSSAVSISLATSPDGCLSFSIDGGGGAILGTTNVTFGAINLTEDSPESQTGTIDDATGLQFTTADGSGTYAYTMDISNGTYDLTAGTFQFDYVFYDADGNALFPGVLIYN